MATPYDPDQLLALALTRVPPRHLSPVHTHEEILATARRARARAAQTRRELQATRENVAAALVETLRVRAYVTGGLPDGKRARAVRRGSGCSGTACASRLFP